MRRPVRLHIKAKKYEPSEGIVEGAGLRFETTPEPLQGSVLRGKRIRRQNAPKRNILNWAHLAISLGPQSQRKSRRSAYGQRDSTAFWKTMENGKLLESV